MIIQKWQVYLQFSRDDQTLFLGCLWFAYWNIPGQSSTAGLFTSLHESRSTSLFFALHQSCYTCLEGSPPLRGKVSPYKKWYKGGQKLVLILASLSWRTQHIRLPNSYCYAWQINEYLNKFTVLFIIFHFIKIELIVTISIALHRDALKFYKHFI